MIACFKRRQGIAQTNLHWSVDRGLFNIAKDGTIQQDEASKVRHKIQSTRGMILFADVLRNMRS